MADNKNPFEIRLETLKMAKEMMDAQYELQTSVLKVMVDQCKKNGADVQKVLDEYLPDMYNPNKVVAKAAEFYEYVSKK